MKRLTACLLSVLTHLLWLSAEAQTLQTLCSFNSTNGANPGGALIQGTDGNFYGTTEQGGKTNSNFPNGMGTVFRVTPSGFLSLLLPFNGTNGATPYAGLTLGTDGNFYGTTSEGGLSYGGGTIFKVTTNGSLTTLFFFSSMGFGGFFPEAGLTLGNDGNFYGSTRLGGYPNDGTLFQMTPNGNLTTILSFGGSYGYPSGALPQATLALGPDGNFYGTTQQGGTDGTGTIFAVTTNGTPTMLADLLYYFGESPNGLTLGNDRKFYGTSIGGNYSYGYGTIFSVTTNGTVDLLFFFDGANGSSPLAALTLGNDGNFYGSTAYGGSTNLQVPDGGGTIYKVTPTGTLTTLFDFNGTNGAYSHAPLTLGTDGNFYGTTGLGGLANAGTVFRLLIPPFINLQPQSLTNTAGSTVAFSVLANNPAATVYQWQKNETDLLNGGNLSGVSTKKLTITDISDSDGGNYCVVVSNANGVLTSSIATLTVVDPICLSAQPTNLLVFPGTNVTLGVTLTGSPPLFYQWLLNSTNLVNATNPVLAIPSVGPLNAGNYAVLVSNWAGTVMSSNASLTVVLSPGSLTNYASSKATFTAPSFGPGNLAYQWQKNATNLLNGGRISGATNATLTIADVSDSDAGLYDVIVTDASASLTTSNATLAVVDSLLAVSEPQSQTVLQGSSVTFNFAVYGAAPFLFQWYFDFSGSPLNSSAMQTNVASLTLTNVGVNLAGYYQAEVINADGSLWSSYVYLTVIVPPKLTLQIVSGYPLLNLQGMFGYNYGVQYTTNLAGTNWINLLSLTNLQSSPYLFLDPQGVGWPAKFYRAIMLP